MEVSVEHLGDVQFEIRAGQHTIYADQPIESGGHDEGMTPPDLLLASLGSCAGFYAAMYLRKHKLASEGTVVRVHADKFKNRPAWTISASISMCRWACRTHKAGVEEAVHHCLIHNTLLHPPQISIAVKSSELLEHTA